MTAAGIRIKICGITSYDDAMTAIHAGADALGFVFYPPSARYISPDNARLIIERLPPFVEKVGLFVNEEARSINHQAKLAQTTLSQLHFDVPHTTLADLDHPYLRVIRAKNAGDVYRYDNEYRLIDAYCEAYGGMGKRLNLEWFKDVDCSKIILAGGLNPTNVTECLPYRFYGLDVSSGVEKAKGVKDAEKIQAFISRADAW